MTLRKLSSLLSIFLNVACLLAAFPPLSSAQPDEDRKFLLMYFKEEELVVESPTRSRKSLTQVAENMTVVTAEEIKLMNAHTVADVLNAITGVQVLITGGPGSAAQASLQGSDISHVTVFMDGIPLNNLSDNITDIGSLPVQNIDRIEIVKGPASSAWGSSLGGVINIITKSGSDGDKCGMTSASYGKRNTGDFRVETSGKEMGFGYYVNAGRLRTDGFRPHNDFSGNNAYTKLTYDVTKDTRLLFTMGYDKLSRGVVEVPNVNFVDNSLETFRWSVAADSAINDETSANISFWQMRQTNDFTIFDLSPGQILPDVRQKLTDNGYGSSAKLSWKRESHNVVLGAEADAKTLESNTLTGGKQKLTKIAFFLNDTMSIGRVSVTPGVRQDHTNLNGDFTSPSLGMTYKIADSTLLRAYGARGFNIPPIGATNINPDLTMEKVWSYELGAETAALRYFWLKLSGFRHEIRDAILPDVTGKPVNSKRQRREGMEAEIKTTPFHHLSLSSGAAFINTKDLDTGETVPEIPQRTYDVGLHYDDEKSFKVLLRGHSIYWNSLPSPDPSFQGKYNSFIFDLHITKIICTRGDQALEAFGDIHNIFNGSQYPLAIYVNPERWLEAGIRYMF